MIGIVAATQGEADKLIALLGAEKLCDDPFVTYDFEGGVLVLSGMGPENAAHATEHLLNTHAPQRVLNIGICGALNDDIQVGEVYRITAVVAENAAKRQIPTFGNLVKEMQMRRRILMAAVVTAAVFCGCVQAHLKYLHRNILAIAYGRHHLSDHNNHPVSRLP